MNATLSPVMSPLGVDESQYATDHRIESLPILVIFPHNQCNCRCAMCDIWKIRQAQEITPEELDRELGSLRKLGVQWAVFSGGEPQMNRKWFLLARMLKDSGIRVTMLTAGLLLEQQARFVAENTDDIIVSLDGPPSVHNAIRRIPDAFDRMAAGVKALRDFRPDMVIRSRCTVQKGNHALLRATVQAARQAELNSISFLAADLTSWAFNRPTGWSSERQAKVALTSMEVDALEAEIGLLIEECSEDFRSGFVIETPDKLRRIARHFRAHLGQQMHVAPCCNAPWVSVVIEAGGDVRPCFFHAPIGNIRQHSLIEILNGPAALQFREHLDVVTNPICKRCVCALNLPWPRAKVPDVA